MSVQDNLQDISDQLGRVALTLGNEGNAAATDLQTLGERLQGAITALNEPEEQTEPAPAEESETAGVPEDDNPPGEEAKPSEPEQP